MSHRFATNFAEKITQNQRMLELYASQMKVYTRELAELQKKIDAYAEKCAACPGCNPTSLKSELKKEHLRC